MEEHLTRLETFLDGALTLLGIYLSIDPRCAKVIFSLTRYVRVFVFPARLRCSAGAQSIFSFDLFYRTPYRKYQVEVHRTKKAPLVLSV